MAKKSITIRLREELIDRLEEEAEENDVTRSERIRTILEDYPALLEELEDTRDKLHEREETIMELEDRLESYLENDVDVEGLEAEIERLRDRLEAREDRVDELETQLARRSQVETKIDTLVEYEEDPDPPWPVRWYRWIRR